MDLMSGLGGDMTLTEAAHAIAAGHVSSAELTAQCLASLAAQGAELNCVAGMDAEKALAAAQAADRQLASGSVRGLLHGVPLAHKDMFYRRGRISGCGSRIRANFIADETSTALEKLDAAGALDIARLNMVEFAYGPTGHNGITGTPRNPHNPAYITGGSSSGPAAAVAAGLIYGSLGSDTGGSIRIPASCCGIVGIKPTYGRVSRAGAMGLSFTLDHIGPLARTVADCALLLRVIAGRDEHDATTSRRPVPDYPALLDQPVKALRIAVPENYFYDPVKPEVRRVVEQTLEVYRRLGAKIVRVTIPSVELANPMVMLIMAVEAASMHARWLKERPQDYGKQTLGRLMPGLMYPATQYVDALKLRQKVMADFSRGVFEKADVLHLPVIPIEVPTIAESDIAANPGFSEFLLAFGHCTRPFNYLGLPAISIPAGVTPNGLPCGFQLVGRPFDEATLFAAGYAYEREMKGQCRATALLRK
jgi:aspartyl-tRNA(Asn)/glutamyl-tRNA(Gln) amidotransferase subunit A